MKFVKNLIIHSSSIIAFALAAFASDTPKQPNIVFILIDDMGVSDIGANGAKFYETPNIDALCKEGVNFTNAYTSVSICAPARASAMTGKHPAKLGMWNHHHHMPDGTKSVAAFLKDAGYVTWHVGKWHCGSPENKTLPQDVGFDVNIAGWESWAPATYFWPYRKNRAMSEDQVPTRSRVPGLEQGGKEGEYLTDRLTDEAVKLIENADTSKPFFLNLWHYAVHSPHMAKPEKIEKYERKLAQYKDMNKEYFYDAKGTRYFENPTMSKNVPVYAAMIESVDESVGKIVETLKKKGVYDNTLIIFYSDNGPTTNTILRTPYRGGKNSTYEGGLREPAFMVWKGKVLPASSSDAFINICDIPYTILDAAQTGFPQGYDGDGKSLLPLSEGKEKSAADREFFWYFPSTRTHWGQYASAAYKDKDNFKYQMLFNGDPDELYDLSSDPDESNNLIETYPDRAKAMEAKIREFLNKYYSKMPKPDEIYIENVERRLRGEPALRVEDKNY